MITTPVFNQIHLYLPKVSNKINIYISGYHSTTNNDTLSWLLSILIIN